jgi:endo-1,4-beta-xylanase
VTGENGNHIPSPIIDGQFSRLTSTQFYPFQLWKGPRQYDFKEADQAVQEAIQSRRPLHAHCLLYTLESISPEFMLKFQGSPQQLEELVRHYLTSVLTRYRGRVGSYDVFNELFAYNSGEVQKSWLRRHFASDQEFFDFVGRCYGYAHAADPQAVLFYADYGQEFSSQQFAKGMTIAHQLFRWKRQRVPIHGYALHFHTNIYRPKEDLDTAIRVAVKTGLKIHLSEVDVSCNCADPDVKGRRPGDQGVRQITPQMLEQQKQMFRHIALSYRRLVPPAQQFGITVWDIGDADSWLSDHRFEAGTMFDTHYRPKPAFYGFLQGLSEKL